MSERDANLALVERSESQWKVGKHFSTIPPVRRKLNWFQRLINFFKG